MAGAADLIKACAQQFGFARMGSNIDAAMQRGIREAVKRNYAKIENVKENLDQNIYKTIIPRNVRLAEAPSYGKPINLYDSRSTGAESYRLLAEEVIGREGE